MVPAHDAGALDAFFRLEFGMQQAYAVRGLSDLPVGEERVEVRRAGPEDYDLLAPLMMVIADHQQSSPVFAYLPPHWPAEFRSGHAESLADDEVEYLVALRDGVAVGALIMSPTESDLHVPEHCMELQWAATIPDERGMGTGVALTARALRWARDAGYRNCSTDWRVTNLLSSRFWPRRGFVPVLYRLVRTLDPRLGKPL
jgi:GNAT superfamily N-acetyltransferase